MTPPETRYARAADGVHIAYQAVGSGPIDLLLVDTWVHHVEAVWDFPDYARFLRRLAGFARVIHFDPPRHRIELSDRGEHELKGVPDRWRLYAVTRLHG